MQFSTYARTLLGLLIAVALFSCKGDPGAPGGTNVYDANDALIGKMVEGGTELGILFSDNKYGRFTWSGYSSNGYCAGSSFCGSAVTYSANNMYLFDPAVSALSASKSYIFFTSSNCSGTPYISFKPSENSIFRTGDSTFYYATGDETQTTGLSIGSMYLHDKGSCANASGNGVCCSSILNTSGAAITNASGYALSNSYSFPSGISHPLTGPFYFK